MGGMKINFAEVEGGFEPVPEGRYDVIVDRVEVRESKSSDNDYLNWEMSIQDDDYEGQKLWMITSLSPRALFRLKDIFVELDICGEDDEIDLDWDDDVDITPQEGPVVTNPELEGIAAVAVVENEMYEGKERNRVEELLSAGAEVSRKEPDEDPEEEPEEEKKPARRRSPAKKSAAKKGGRKAASGSRRKLR